MLHSDVTLFKGRTCLSSGTCGSSGENLLSMGNDLIMSRRASWNTAANQKRGVDCDSKTAARSFSCSPNKGQNCSHKNISFFNPFSPVHATINHFHKNVQLLGHDHKKSFLFSDCLFMFRGSLVLFVPCVLSAQLKSPASDLDMSLCLFFNIFEGYGDLEGYWWKARVGKVQWVKFMEGLKALLEMIICQYTFKMILNCHTQTLITYLDELLLILMQLEK